MDYIRDDQIKKFDEVVEQEGIKVVIDSKALIALIGTEMSY
jgi:Fe-S cluster assembly iron-binding protein IscA